MLRIFQRRGLNISKESNRRFIQTYVNKNIPAPENTRPQVIIKSYASDNQKNKTKFAVEIK